MPRQQAIALSCALLLGAAIAFPAGLLLGSSASGGEREGRPASRSSGGFREIYSPSIRNDPYFLEQQRQNVEALEQACRSSGEFCDEAQQVRRLLTELEEGTP